MSWCLRTPSKRNELTGHKGITLAAELEYEMGRKIINEYPLLQTNITTHAFDVDVLSSYPWSEVCLNVSKTTRIFELCKIKGLDTQQQRAIGINLTNVKANPLSLAVSCFNFPSFEILLTTFKETI